MITRAKRVFPGMVMTLLLTVPAMAATAELLTVPAMAATADTVQSDSTRIEHKAAGYQHHADRAKVGTKPVGSSAQPDRVATKVAPTARAPTRPASVARSRPRDVVPTLLQGGDLRIIRRASAQGPSGSIDRNLIDDGTLWRERGSVATWQQTGMASWYGGTNWQGHRTSSGSRYDQNELTAAHATLPLGTKVRVTSHSGTRSVIVTINDRPGTRTRIIDLSREAAKELGILDAGVVMVTLQPM